MRLLFIALFLVITISCKTNQATETPASAKTKIILDTDFGNDCDDTGALAILHQMVYNGEAELVATMYPMNDSLGAAAIDAINTWYGKPDVPTGTYKGDYVYKGKHNDFYNSRLASMPNDLRSGNNAPDAVALYRSLLSKADDNSITIVVVGPQRLLADLLVSIADSSSDLSGKELIRRKVRRLVSMGTEHPKGHEWNIRIAPEAAQLVAEEWPTDVYYSGFEIGHAIMTGERLITETPATNPVRVAFETNPMVDSLKNRHSWDQTAVLFAVRGPADYWNIKSGNVMIDSLGRNEWTENASANRFYLTPARPPADMKKIIEDMMVAPPQPQQ